MTTAASFLSRHVTDSAGPEKEPCPLGGFSHLPEAGACLAPGARLSLGTSKQFPGLSCETAPNRPLLTASLPVLEGPEGGAPHALHRVVCPFPDGGWCSPSLSRPRSSLPHSLLWPRCFWPRGGPLGRECRVPVPGQDGQEPSSRPHASCSQWREGVWCASAGVGVCSMSDSGGGVGTKKGKVLPCRTLYWKENMPLNLASAVFLQEI